MSRQLTHEASVNSPPGHPAYVFTRNNPYDREAAIEMVLPQLLDSATYMRSIREFQVPGAMRWPSGIWGKTDSCSRARTAR